MFHPETELRFINETYGRGVFAHNFIPKGTIMYVNDPMDAYYRLDSPLLQDPRYGAHIRRYGYLSEDASTVIVCWDLSKHINHACEANTLSTAYGFDIAIKDIQPGEHITDDYGQLKLLFELECQCGSPICRKKILHAQFDQLVDFWNARTLPIIPLIPTVAQPLLPYVNPDEYAQLLECIKLQKPFRSIETLKIPTHQQ